MVSNYQTGKCLDMTAYVGTGSKNSLPSKTDWLSKSIDANKKQTYPTKGKTTLIQKDPKKRTASNNYRPITCLPMIWKILMPQIREEI